MPPAHKSSTDVKGNVFVSTPQNLKCWSSPVNDFYCDYVRPPTHDGNENKRVGVAKIPPPMPPPMADGTITSVKTRGNVQRKEKRKKRQYNVRNKNRPKRPLSAYNLFFRYERERIVRESLTDNGRSNVEAKTRSQDKTRTGKRVHRKTHGAIGFAELGKHISEAWKSLDENDRIPYQAEAEKEKECYQRKLGAMTQHAPDGTPGKTMRGAYSTTLEARDSSPVVQKNTNSSYLTEYFDRQHIRCIDIEEGQILQHRSRSYHLPAMSPTVHLPKAHFECFGYFGNERQCAPTSFVPPLPIGPRFPSEHGPHYGYQLPTLNNYEESHEGGPQQDTLHAFSPTFTSHQFNDHNYPPQHPNQRVLKPPGDYLSLKTKSASSGDFAFQCEVCSSAVFSTFQECANHEEECALNIVSSRKSARPLDDGSPCNNKVSQQSYNMSPSLNNKKAEVEEQQQAVEAVMMLKNPIEC
eukprot:CAMPEP_0172308262 /NCGR_PEP_ID=MMETSP1058-20130122/8918_1 /TAXON_ID=83371 /ORGANISM="Detonula confervacea, Strain CCMP 353" /LENGTH=466 /DNA_ID=CAMNT_0013020641 /DNA_START=87 /DNA_END=1487 /DNA_ORIENTATION=+